MVQNAFELYGADFMLSENYTPWLLEVNSSPGMLPSSIEKTKLCAAVIQDTIKGNSIGTCESAVFVRIES